MVRVRTIYDRKGNMLKTKKQPSENFLVAYVLSVCYASHNLVARDEANNKSILPKMAERG